MKITIEMEIELKIKMRIKMRRMKIAVDWRSVVGDCAVVSFTLNAAKYPNH